MITSRPLHAPVNPPADAAAPRPSLRESWVRFWFSPVDPAGLHVLRVLAGLLFLAWLLPFVGHAADLFGPQGWFDTRAYHEAARLPEGVPVPLGWSVLNLCRGPAAVNAAYGLSLAVLVLFTLGVATRLTSVLTWVVVASFASSPVGGFEADWLLGILAFYLMVGYLLLGQWDGRPSLLGRILGTGDAWLFRRRRAGAARPTSYAANLALRLLQVHFALILVVSGLHKLQYGDWWAGVALWYPLHPPFQATPAGIKALAPQAQTYLVLLSLAAYGVLAWQIAFPLFAWRPRWRAVLLSGAALGWLGASLVWRQPLFGPVLGIVCLGYLTPAEWQWLLGLPRRLFGMRAQAPQAHAPASVPAKVGARS